MPVGIASESIFTPRSVERGQGSGTSVANWQFNDLLRHSVFAGARRLVRGCKPNGGHPEFKSRHDALRIAVNSALSAGQWGEATLITVEGVDGLWRMFDHQAKGVV